MNTKRFAPAFADDATRKQVIIQNPEAGEITQQQYEAAGTDD